MFRCFYFWKLPLDTPLLFLGGVILLKLFDQIPSHNFGDFLGWLCLFCHLYYRLCSSKTLAWIKKYYSHKSAVSNAKEGGLKKIFLGLPKLKNLIFSKNLNSVICPNMGGGQGSCHRHPVGGVRSLGSIC